MAIRKLTTEQKVVLRTEISDRLAKGDKVAAIVAEGSERYGISENTVRWYMKRMGATPIRRRRRARRAQRVGRVTGATIKAEFDALVERVYALSEEHLANAKSIRDLQLKLTALLLDKPERAKRTYRKRRAKRELPEVAKPTAEPSPPAGPNPSSP